MLDQDLIIPVTEGWYLAKFNVLVLIVFLLAGARAAG